MSPRLVLADSHVHLDRYPPPLIAAMLRRARQAGVRHFLAIGVDESTSATAAALAGTRRGVRAAIGIHPTRVGGLELRPTIAHLRDLTHQPGIVAIGEVGLDETSTAPATTQEAFFAAFLELAAELGLAVSLHVVGQHRRAQQMLSAAGTGRAVVHYFQGDTALAESYLETGCCISLGKPVVRADRVALREAARRIPLQRLLLETDTYPLPGRTTEPRDVVEVCRTVAELHGISIEEVAEATTANHLRLFAHPRRRMETAR